MAARFGGREAAARPFFWRDTALTTAPSKRWLLYTALPFQSSNSAPEVATPLASIVSDRSSAFSVVNQPGMPEASFSSSVTAATHARSGAFPRLSGS